MNTPPYPPRDPRDTTINGIIVGICIPIVAYGILKIIEKILAGVLPEFNQFSLRFLCVTALVANIIPMQIFLKQNRDYAAQAVIGTTIVLLFCVIYYFRDSFFAA